MDARRVLVSGRVQGVGFRAFTERTAARLGLCGWVRNLADGRVEVWAEGPEARVGELLDALRVGPRLAGVDALDVAPRAPQGYEVFFVRPDADGPAGPEG